LGKKLLCLTFTSNSIHIAAALEIISEIHKGYTQTEFAWMGHKTLYASRMARNLDGLKFASRKNFFTKYLDLIPNLNYQYSETLTFDSSIFWHYKNSFAKQLNKCKTLEDLLNLNYDGIKPGSALINTLVN
jgi:hypothetical protein